MVNVLKTMLNLIKQEKKYEKSRYKYYRQINKKLKIDNEKIVDLEIKFK